MMWLFLALKKRVNNLIGIISKDIGYLSALSANDNYLESPL